MDALEEWRPQIFYSDGAMKGQPVGDNTRKRLTARSPSPRRTTPLGITSAVPFLVPPS